MATQSEIKAIRSKYLRDVERLLGQMDRRGEGFAKEAKRHLRAFRRVLIDRMNQVETPSDVMYFARMREVTDAEIAELDRILQATARRQVDDMAALGEDALKRPLLGLPLGPGREAAIGQIIGLDPARVLAAKTHSADLVGLASGGLAASVLKAINTEISLGALGAKAPTAVIRDIATAIGDQSPHFSRAERIFRTESLTISSLSQEAAARNMNQIVPMVKTWKWSGNGPTRATTHGAIDGKTIPVGHKFHIPRKGRAGKDLAMFPRDPLLPPEQRINCGCAMLVEPDFDKLVA